MYVTDTNMMNYNDLDVIHKKVSKYYFICVLYQSLI